MNTELKRRLELPIEEGSAEAARLTVGAAASAAVVNRTHRIVRERAKTIKARQSRVRSLLLPLAVFSGILIVICTALWTVLDEYELAPTGIPDASQQMFVLMIWCLPVSAVLLALVLFQRAKSDNGSENGSMQ
jgi:cytochrome bd-type quinol oxidase subunit 2